MAKWRVYLAEDVKDAQRGAVRGERPVGVDVGSCLIVACRKLTVDLIIFEGLRTLGVRVSECGCDYGGLSMNNSSTR